MLSQRSNHDWRESARLDKGQVKYQPEGLAQESLSYLVDMILKKLKDEREILMQPYPQREKRFDAIKMPFLLKAQSNDVEEIKFYQ